MKSLKLCLSTSIFTFAVGFSAVWGVSLLPKMEEFLFPASASLEDSLAQIPTPSQKNPRFKPMVISLNSSSRKTIETNDGQQLGVYSVVYPTTKEARAELKRMLAKAEQIIERVPNAKNIFGEVGERIVLVNPPKSDPQARILWYRGSKTIQFIDAPSLELALEYEAVDKK